MGKHRPVTTLTITVQPPFQPALVRYARISLEDEQLQDHALVSATLLDLSNAILEGMFGEENGTD